MQNSPLGRLASELRNDIFERALASADPFRITAALSDGKLHLEQKRPAKRHAHPTALLQVCRQLRAECSELFYASNKFAVASDALCSNSNVDGDELCILTRFQATIGEVNYGAIQSITVEIERKNIEEEEVHYDPRFRGWQFEALLFLARLPDYEAVAMQNPHCKLRLKIKFGWKASAHCEMSIGWHRPFDFTPVSFDLKMCPEWFPMSRAIAKTRLEEELRFRIGFCIIKPITLGVLISGLASYGKKPGGSCT